jgi:hypothetical protein
MSKKEKKIEIWRNGVEKRIGGENGSLKYRKRQWRISCGVWLAYGVMAKSA